MRTVKTPWRKKLSFYSPHFIRRLVELKLASQQVPSNDWSLSGLVAFFNRRLVLTTRVVLFGFHSAVPSTYETLASQLQAKGRADWTTSCANAIFLIKTNRDFTIFAKKCGKNFKTIIWEWEKKSANNLGNEKVGVTQNYQIEKGSCHSQVIRHSIDKAQAITVKW